MTQPYTVEVLIVEDEATIRELFVTTLEHYFPGIGIDVAVDGAEAIAKMSAGCRPELILTNLVMPNLDGEQLLRWVRIERPGTPVVAVSAIRTNAAFDGYLGKPVELGELLACIGRWLPEWQPSDLSQPTLGSTFG